MAPRIPSGGGGGSTYVPNTPPKTTRPGSYTGSALSVYSRPSAAIMYSDLSSATALNQRLIQEALERARLHAEEMRRLAEERRRQEEQRRIEAAERRRAAEEKGRESSMSPTPAFNPYTGNTPQWVTDAKNQNWPVESDQVGTGTPGIDYYAPGFIRSGKAARAMGAEGWNPAEAMYRETSTAPWGSTKMTGGYVPGSEGKDGIKRAGDIITAAEYNAYKNFDAVRDVPGMYEGSPNWKELSERYEGPNYENFYAMAFQAAVNTWTEPTPIYEKVFTGRYDENGNKDYEDKIVGYNWNVESDANVIDPATGLPMEIRQYSKPAYLGVDPGFVAINVLPRPAEDADLSEWRRYYNSLKTGIATPQYKPTDPIDTLNKMDVKARAQLQRQLIAANLYDPEQRVVLGQLDDATIEIVAGLMSYGNRAGTTWEVQLQQSIDFAKELESRQTDSGYGGGGGGGGGTTTYKQIQYSQTSTAQARSMLIGILTEALGRYPTDDEVADFLSMLNKQEKKSPSRTVTRTTTDGSNTTAVTRMTPSTVDAQALAEDFAKSLDGYEENAVDRYLNALFDGLGEGRV